MTFQPIAIVGRSCLLPGAASPEQLWDLVSQGRSEIRAVDGDRWRLDVSKVLCDPQAPRADATWSDRGGYVRGFEDLFDPSGFELAAAEILELDPMFQWALHTAREALADSGHRGTRDRVGAVFGNLGFPSTHMSGFAESVWLDQETGPHPRNRFNSGLPALLLERALGLGGGAFTLDAACASSLYAIKVACDWLQQGRRDLVLAGAVNRADDLFIHVGFTALQALSKTGQSRPFHPNADGLVAAEGAGFVALKRLEDAERDGDKIWGLIRGVGLSNDGRGRGFLVPSSEGQSRAMRAALEQSGLEAADISMVECHATGTTIGDATELASMKSVYRYSEKHDRAPLAIGSLKSNLGHLITAAGVAGLIKVLEAMRHKTRPPTLHASEPNPALDTECFRAIQTTEEWPSDGRRHAAVSAFGFGGNNAHLIVTEHVPDRNETRAAPSQAISSGARNEPPVEVAIVGIGVTAADAAGRAAFTSALFDESLESPDVPARTSDTERREPEGRAADFSVDIAALGIPPNDLDQTLAQQLLLFEAAREATAETGALPRERTGVYVGSGTDPEVARYGARWRHGEGFTEPLRAAGVVGTMPNIPANRLNRWLDVGGASCAVSAEEASGLVALDLAVSALQRGELDAALVGAVDLSCEPVHRAAARACLGADLQKPGDAAVVLVVKRLADAQRDNDRIYAVVSPRGEDDQTPATETVWGPADSSLTNRFGHAHAASGLLHLAAAALSVHHRRSTDGSPWLSDALRKSDVVVKPMDGTGVHRWSVREVPRALRSREVGAPTFHLYEGANASEVLDALAAGRVASLDDQPQPTRLVLVANSEDQLAARTERARAHIAMGTPAGQGVHYRPSPVTGELSFVFTSAGSAYPGMGRELLAALPELGDALAKRFTGLPESMGWVFRENERESKSEPTNTDRLWGASALSQLHAQLSREILGLKPSAALGYSSGESNSLFAFGAWRDIDAMRADCDDAGLFDRELGGEFRVAKKLYGPEAEWTMWSVLAPVEDVRAAVAVEPHVHLAIVHTASDCVLGGEAAACARVIERLGRHRARPLEYNLTVHVPELGQKREEWLRVHRRQTFDVPSVRFYSGAFPAAYRVDSERCAEALLGQAEQQLDFPRMVEQAWADGVRTFVEHGPGGSCSHWIREILGPERMLEALVVPLDRRGHGLAQAVNAAAALVAAGIDLDPRPLLARLAGARTKPPAKHPGAVRLIAAHPATVSPTLSLSPSSNGNQLMHPAPKLPPVIDSDFEIARGPQASATDDSQHLTADENSRVPTSAAIPTTVVAPQIGAAGSSELASLAASPLGFLSQVHTQFLEQQAAVHTRFLAMRASLIQMRPHSQTAVLTHSTPPQAALRARSAVLPASLPSPPSLPSPQEPRVQAPPTAPSREPKIERAAPTRELESGEPIGPMFDRAQLEVAASGKLSELFGPMFVQQDQFARQVRMPEPPLLLADRVTGIDAEPGVLAQGTIWTETDVHADSWYLNRGRMPAGIFIESGQADLLLISWMGADFANQGERVYRLLGCTLTFVDDLPAPGDTLVYDIHVDGHAKHEDVRLFFFHYDCRIDGELRLSVRDGQAGFFTDDELAQSAGIVWSADSAELSENPRLEPPDQLSPLREFSAEKLRAFANGRAYECFGAGFEDTQCHVASPAIQDGQMLFLDEVTTFSPTGGPWGRGYLQARSAIGDNDWYFDGHFKNDPCMPGTLMFEGCVQALSFYLAALGFTIKRDGWRFRPVSGEPIEMKCRGQATPSSREITYEVFVEEVISGPEPTIYADLLCTINGLKAFHAKRVGLQLVPDWPLESRPELLAGHVETKPVAIVKTSGKPDFAFDYESLLSCAWGRPSKAFGPIYERFDSARGVARLPGPPYHFITRIASVEGAIGEPVAGAAVVAEYDVPADAWYFDASSNRSMPYAVLLEAALQPCGWLASYIGCALTTDTDLLFRNLDGTGTQHAEVLEGAGCIETHVKLTSVSKSAGMIIVSFTVETLQSGTLVFDMTTVFGFFPTSAFDNQAGLPVSDEQREFLERASETSIDLTSHPERFYSGGASLPGSKLDMLNHITGFWPEGGAAGLGSMRAIKKVSPADWYFKAHFFQDPVQPGSLGIEALIQLLQCFMLETRMDEGIANPRFEPIATGMPLTWKYRGQVVPKNKTVTSTIEVTDIGRDELGPFAICDGSLWVDGLRIYSTSNLAMRIISENRKPKPSPSPSPSLSPSPTRSPSPSLSLSPTPTPNSVVLDPQTDTWLADHCPTWNRPALPMMSIASLLAAGAQGTVTGLKDVQVKGWLDFTGPRRLHTRSQKKGGEQWVELWATPSSDLSAEPTEVARARVQCGTYGEPPVAWNSITAREGREMDNPYESGNLFHGPSFQRFIRGTVCDAADAIEAGEIGASSILDAQSGNVPVWGLNPVLLDAALHSIPHDEMLRWSDRIAVDCVAYPARLLELNLFGPTPTTGQIRCEVRFDGFLHEPDLPRFRIQLIGASGVWAAFTLVEACFPKGRLGAAPPRQRRAFLRGHEFVQGLRLSRLEDGCTRLTAADVKASDWMPGTVLGIYGTEDVAEIAALEHVASRERVHPAKLPEALPLNPANVSVTADDDEVVVRDLSERVLDPSSLREFWSKALGIDGPWLGRDLWEGLLRQYVGRVVLEDPDSFERVKASGRGVLFLGNHQVQIESLLITNILSGLTNRPVVTMANAKHEQRWIGWILQHLYSHPEICGRHTSPPILYFDQARPETMLQILAKLKPALSSGNTSFFLHPEGTRARSCSEPTTTVSSAILDLAVELDLPVVPIRFVGGLPVDPIAGKAEFPWQHGAQDYVIGRHINAAELRELPYASRGPRVIDAINSLAGRPEHEEPSVGDQAFADAASEWQTTTGVSEIESVFYRILEKASRAE